jgi:hypothetical protein
VLFSLGGGRLETELVRAAPRRAVGARAVGRAARVPARPGPARLGGLVLLAVLLVWMPEVPLDLAVVVAAGLLVFAGAGEVVRLTQRSLIR